MPIIARRTKTCTKCAKTEEQVARGKKRDGGFAWKDPQGRHVSGRTCAPCFNRSKNSEYVVRITREVTSRTCRVCSSRLCSSRYFQCETCQPTLTSEQPYEQDCAVW